MFTPQKFLSALAVSNALCLLSFRAEACACCDGSSTMKAIGWSPTGLSILVRHEKRTQCIPTVALEVHNVGQGGAAGCFDLLGKPEVRVDCNNLSHDHPTTPGRSSQEDVYREPIKSIDPAWIQFDVGKPLSRQEHWTSHAKLKVQGTSVEESFTFRNVGINPEQALTFDTQPRVAILPTLDRKKAALLINGVDTDPVMGHEHRGWELRWISLPEELEVPLVDGVAWSTGLRDFSGVESFMASHALSLKANSIGLKHHKAKQFREAIDYFTLSVDLNPTEALLSRYNLACALAQVGASEHALAVLSDLLAKAPTEKAEERRLRARKDTDLAPLHPLREFQQLICGGLCPEMAPPESKVAVPTSSKIAPDLGQLAPPSEVPSSARQTKPNPTEAKETKSGLSGCSLQDARAPTSPISLLMLGFLGAFFARRSRASRHPTDRREKHDA